MKTIAIAVSFVGLLMAADAQQSFTGVITDTMCGAKHEMMKDTPDEQCVKMCLKGSSDYALYDGREVWKFSNHKEGSAVSRQEGSRHRNSRRVAENHQSHLDRGREMRSRG